MQRLLIRLQAPHTGIEVRDRFHRWDHVTRCFTGRGLIAWLQANTGYQSRGDALRVASHLLGLNLITPVSSYATALAQSAYPLDLAPSPPINRQRFLAEEERKVETPSQFGGGGGAGPGSGTNGFDFHDDETLYHFVSETEMEESLAYADNLVREYLLFNGMTSTLNAMEKERRGDNRAVSFRARKIVTQLLGFAQSFDFRAMLELWNFLERHFFVKIDPSFLPTIQKLFTSLQRFYLINAINTGAPEKAREFLEVNIGNFRGRPEWERWFMLPFLEKPQTDPSFEMYFAKDWSDAFSLSLGNFLNTLFTHLPLPKMLNFTIERKMRQAMELELSQLRVQCKERQTLIGTLQRQIQDLQSSPSSRTPVSSTPSLLPLVTPASTNASGLASVDISKPSHHHHQSHQQSQQHQPLSETWKMDADKPVTPNSPGIARDISPMTARQVMDRLSEQPLPSVSVEAHPMLTVQSMTMAGDTAGLSNVMISSNPSISSFSSFSSSSSSSSSSNSQSYSQPSSPVTEMEHIECIVPYSTFVEHKSPVRRCKFSRSGHLIATGSSDGTVRIWPTPKPSLTSSPQRSAEGHSDATHSTIF
ncbi:MAG: hypothetical protein Q8P67_13465, partial [archaeon]|nr:hypothetical protein [archaeon]